MLGSQISKSGKFLLKLRVHHSIKFAPKEVNPLYFINVRKGMGINAENTKYGRQSDKKLNVAI